MQKVMVGNTVRVVGGMRPTTNPHKRMMAEPPSSAAIAPKTDLSPWMPPIFDQGQIGSCTANMGCEQMEFLERQGQLDRIFSRLWLYAAVRELEGTPLTEDSGAECPNIYRVLETQGLPYEEEWPYVDVERNFAVKPPQSAYAAAAAHKALLSFACPSVRSIRASLTQGFPVGFGMQVYDNMMSVACAASGIVRLPGPGEKVVGGHAVTICGHDDLMQIANNDGTTTSGAFLVQNHWGTAWGAGGRFWLPMAYFDKGLASDAITLRSAEV